jgi:hypothetical protein
MKYTKFLFGKSLKKHLDNETEVSEISRWCYRVLSENLDCLNLSEQELLFKLSTMDDDVQFEFTSEELYRLAENLIQEGQEEELSQPVSSIKERAERLDETWLMCPLCQEAWESKSVFGMVCCPGCKNKLHNPKYSENE